MATYRLKSKLYGEFDEKKDKGISAGQVLAIGTAALAGWKGYNWAARRGKLGMAGTSHQANAIARMKDGAAKQNFTQKYANSLASRTNVQAAGNRAIATASVNGANRELAIWNGLDPKLAKGNTGAIRKSILQNNNIPTNI